MAPLGSCCSWLWSWPRSRRPDGGGKRELDSRGDHDLSAINGLAGKEDSSICLAVALSRFGPYLLDIALAFFWLFRTTAADRERRQRLVLVAVIAVTGSLLLNQILILIWSRPRPFARPGRDALASASPILRFPATMPRSPSRSRCAVPDFEGIGVPALILAALIGLAVYSPVRSLRDDVMVARSSGPSRQSPSHEIRYALGKPLLALVLRLARRLHLA